MWMILKILRGTTVAGAALFAPNAVGEIAKLLYPDLLPSRRKRKVANALEKLKEMEAIEYDPEGPESKIKLTSKFKRRLKELEIKENLLNLKVKPQKKWDRKWRIVIFDVPEKFKESRDTLRGFLKRLGFTKIQKSVFLCPFPCQVELDVLRETLKLTPYLHFIEATKIDNQSYWEDHFNL